MIILLICFLASGLCGCLLASAAGESGGAAISSFLKSYLALVSDGSAVSPSGWNVLWELCCWPGLVFVLGFTALGAAAIPALFCVRGFLLTYAMSSFYRVFGSAGTITVFTVFGVSALFSVPVLFAVGRVAFSSSAELASGALRERVPGMRIKMYADCVPACVGLIGTGFFAQLTVMPQLLQLASEKLL